MLLNSYFSKLKVFIIFCLTLVAFGCATDSIKNEPPKTPVIDESEYVKLIEKFSFNDKKYNAFYNQYDVTMTIINSKVFEGLIRQEAAFLKWDMPTFQKKREKGFQKRSVSSEVILSLFTPERSHNNIGKAGTMWKIYLISNGIRYDGKAKQVSRKDYAKNMALFPYHNRFSRLYRVKFPVPMNTVEAAPAEIVLTSSLGTSTFKVPASE